MSSFLHAILALYLYFCIPVLAGFSHAVCFGVALDRHLFSSLACDFAHIQAEVSSHGEDCLMSSF